MATNLDPRAADDSPRITLLVQNRETGGFESASAKTFGFESDILTVSDSFALDMPNAEGSNAAVGKPGDSVEVFIADPEVEGGERIRRLKGIVTQRESDVSPAGGSRIQIRGADLGWHLVNNTAPLWLALNGRRIADLVSKCIDPSWGFAGVRQGNDNNRQLNQGRAGAVAIQAYRAGDIYPRFQTEIGQDIASTLIEYATRENLLLNVSSDGYLQLFEPSYNQPPAYRFELHASTSRDAIRNNVIRASLREDIANVYTDITLVWETAINYAALAGLVDAEHPNEGKYRARAHHPTALPFVRRTTMTDAEAWTSTRAKRRVEWKHRRGLFDAWVYSVTVRGLSQGGRFFVPDTMCEIEDDINDVHGRYYVSACSYARDMTAGTTATLTIRKPGLLTAFV